MDEATCKTWWELHRRAALGETLSETERTLYEAGWKRLHAEESLDLNVGALRRTRQAVAEAEAERAQLLKRIRQNQREIRRLEAALSDRPGK